MKVPNIKTQSKDLYMIVDGENMDWQLSDILGHAPLPDDRARWDPVLQFAGKLWGGSVVKPLFFLNIRPQSEAPWPFIRVLRNLNYRPVLLTGDENQKVVDIGIRLTLDAITKRPGNVLLLSHDQDFCEALQKLSDGKRHIGVLVFPESLGKAYQDIEGLEVFDIEHDAGAFPNGPLPRMRPIPINTFDPEALLDSF